MSLGVWLLVGLVVVAAAGLAARLARSDYGYLDRLVELCPREGEVLVVAPRDVARALVERLRREARRPVRSATPRDEELGQADVVMVVDALGRLEPAEQEALLQRLSAALRPGGRLLLRERCRVEGLRQQSARLSGLHLRKATDWALMLNGRGLAVEKSASQPGPLQPLILVSVKR